MKRFIFIIWCVLFISWMPVRNGFGQSDAPRAEAIEAFLAKSGKQLYEETCAACHGNDGKGAPERQVGFDTPRPDFTDCSFASREPDSDWIAVAHQGGPVRGFSSNMPAFGAVYAEDDLQKIMEHIRGFCENEQWPRGELNLPRALVTEKAYPEDEAVVSTSVDVEGTGAVMSEVIYEKRFGARNQIEIVLPFGFRETVDGGWSGGQIGDVALAVKRAFYHSLRRGTIASATAEVILPTGDAGSGFGKGATVLEPFLTMGQILPAASFVQLQGGAEIPLGGDLENEFFLRGVLGKRLVSGRWGRTWSPMLEVLGSRALEEGALVHWDVVPQMQVTLNKRQHVMMNVGVRIPMDDTQRKTQVIVYLLWDWFDGGFFQGW